MPNTTSIDNLQNSQEKLYDKKQQEAVILNYHTQICRAAICDMTRVLRCVAGHICMCAWIDRSAFIASVLNIHITLDLLSVHT